MNPSNQTPQKVTPEELESLRTLLLQKGIDPAQATRGDICRLLAVNDRRARTLQEKLRAGEATLQSKSVVEGDTWNISLPRTRVNTVEELLAKFKVDTTIWEVERFVVNTWDMGFVDDLKKAHSHQLYQCKASLRRKAQMVAVRDEVEALKKEAKAAARTYPKIKRNPKQSGYMLEISIPDLHYAKLAWGKETGDASYDAKLSEQVFEQALDMLISRTSGYAFDEVVFVVGNDLLHADNVQGTTTAGTPQDVDGRFHKSFVKVRLMITRAIEKLRLIAPVYVYVVPGNHDRLSTWCLGDSLSCVFSNCGDVVIDNAPTYRKYHVYGKNMIMYCHGDSGKPADYPLVMATERPVEFGQTTFREAHVGHRHTLKVQELHGVRVRTSPALCPPDAWHSENQYIGNKRSAEAFVWSDNEGMVATAIFNVQEQEKEPLLNAA